MFRIWRRLPASYIKSRYFRNGKERKILSGFLSGNTEKHWKKIFSADASLYFTMFFQGRLFSYNDTHRHRLGANFQQIPVNCPYRYKRVNNNCSSFCWYHLPRLFLSAQMICFHIGHKFLHLLKSSSSKLPEGWTDDSGRKSRRSPKLLPKFIQGTTRG